MTKQVGASVMWIIAVRDTLVMLTSYLVLSCLAHKCQVSFQFAAELLINNRVSICLKRLFRKFEHTLHQAHTTWLKLKSKCGTFRFFPYPLPEQTTDSSFIWRLVLTEACVTIDTHQDARSIGASITMNGVRDGL